MRLLLLCCSASFLIAGCTPENTTENGFLQYEPNPGFVWSGDGAFSYAVKWQPGILHPYISNIYSSNSINSWTPAYGYDWQSEDVTNLSVKWTAGKRYLELPNICSSEKVGFWEARDGYRFVDPQNSLTVKWTPGDRGNENSHVYASVNEGSWAVDPGYETGEISKLALLARGPCKTRPTAKWTPGLWHNQYEHVYSDIQEGYWRPEAGYSFASADSLEVVPSTGTDTDSTSDAASQFWVGVAKVLAGAYFSSDQPDDSGLTSTIGRPAARALRDSGFQDIGDAVTK